MTVQEMIDALSEFDPDQEVVLAGPWEGYADLNWLKEVVYEDEKLVVIYGDT
jgi:hypothetical protein